MTSLRQDWRTPRALYQALDAEFRFTFDPCPPNPQFDGLSVEWGERTFVNPPFKGIEKWIAKGYAEAQKARTVVFLIPARTCTAWWHDFVMAASEIRFIRGRIKYEGAKFNAPFPSCVVVFSGDRKLEGAAAVANASGTASDHGITGTLEETPSLSRKQKEI